MAIVGTVRALWRFPVKSMLGEELDSAEVGEGGVVGDRTYAIRDRAPAYTPSGRPLARFEKMTP